MKRCFTCLPLVILLLLLVTCSPGTAREVDTTGWVDIGGLRIPASWSSSPSEGGGPPDDLNITGEGAGGPIHMFFGYGFAGSIEMLIEESTSSQAFVFDDTHSGYMVEFPDRVIWVRESYTSVTLYHDGDRSVFTDNEDLILRIAGTLTELAASRSLASGPVTLKDDNNGNTVDLYPTWDEEDEGLLFYGNNRFGYSVKVPEIFTKVVLLPDNEDGMILESGDGKAAFRVSGGFVMDAGMLKESYNSALESIGGENNATYFDIGENSWELYWWKDKTFYSRRFLMKGEEAWSDCEISYQSSPDEGMYGPGDEIVHRAIQSLVFGEG